ncbi:YbcC family protein [Parvibium lacunae]|uniref:Probable inorganic carbon transporter subunit DabA n=1 Tax=Parvibium lacunae TaxID=1888893 RepID=A0A368L6R2_9BURK|nr:DUF2309 domain-containing protein [Parvibium lacunae]RCS59304.1 DUF2309 domain-containing protein [Parvibium lacunae]
MNAITPDSVLTTYPAFEPSVIQAAITRACGRIAPTWPLDQFIAVNPYWGFVEQSLPQLGGTLARLSGSPLLMPPAWYQEAWRAGSFKLEDLQRACQYTTAGVSVPTLLGLLTSATPTPAYTTQPRLPLLTHLADEADLSPYHMPWREYVTQSLSQWCGAYYDQHQAQWHADKTAGFFPFWLAAAREDRGPSLQMGLTNGANVLAQLPVDPEAAVIWLLGRLAIPAPLLEDYLTAVLLSLNGWAAWAAYQAWQAQLQQQSATDVLHILAARLTWEYLLFQGLPSLPHCWRQALSSYQNQVQTETPTEETSVAWWTIQHAYELAYQRTLLQGLNQELGATTKPPTPRPAVQAAFCIDVRSEIIRRGFEACSPQIETLGFAGFFGLPVDYMPLASKLARPQLPGLLAAKLRVTDHDLGNSANELTLSAAVSAAKAASADDSLAKLADQRTQRLGWRAAWQGFKRHANAGFSFVETCGLSYAPKLVQASFGTKQQVLPERVGLSAQEAARLQPRIAGAATDASTLPQPLSFVLSQKIELAQGVLAAMSLAHQADRLARLILLVGHGSQTVNNPHAAGLDCGACCGQTGEVNARALAALLNEPAVRKGLQEKGLSLPDDTWFVPALHNTTTDQITLFDTTAMPASHATDLQQLQTWLQQAQHATNYERAGRLDLPVSTNGGLDKGQQTLAITARAMDWSQVRPEWALADNAAFIVAPRARTKSLELAGRTFLHDYQHEHDDGYAILELIMTAPMVVAHWINMQYYASTVDNPRYGSGNKVLHNVVGGHIGVFEGNGGDLRIGLPLQSLHNGERWMHTPLRLTVCIEAPQAPMTAIIDKHPLVRQLLDNGWIHLFQMAAAPSKPAIARYNQGQWQPWEDFPLPH